jgi:hypothetical protein
LLLPFPDLIIDSPASWELAALADRHYPRRRKSQGKRQFLTVGYKMAITNQEQSLVFGWVWQQDGKRWDKQNGFQCSIFRNESDRKSSEVILECERIATDIWGRNRMFTYVDPRELSQPAHKYRKPKTPGYCFLKAGWKFERVTDSGKHLLVKENLR